MNTLAGTYAPLGSVSIKGMRLPAFDKNRIIGEQNVIVFDKPCNYDIILGWAFLQKIGVNLNYKNLSTEWLGSTAPMDNLNSPQMIAKEEDSIYTKSISTMKAYLI